MQRILSLICIACLAWACAETKTATSEPAEPETTAEAAAPQTEILFDGTSLDAWRTYGAESATGWSIDNGAIKTPGGTGDLITKATYSSFDFSLEWKISPGGNSGIFFHVVDDPDTYESVYHTGPEYQLIDNDGYGEELDSLNMTAANYDMQIAHGAAPNPPGEWNTTRIRVEGDAVTHFLNGEEVLSYVLGSDAWKAQLATSKWKDYPGYAMSREGHLALQDHGDPAWFRNIKLTRLD